MRQAVMMIGGASNNWTDVLALEKMLGHPWDGPIMIINDAGAIWPRPFHHWVTLHPEKFQAWEDVRKRQGLPLGYKKWSRRSHKQVDQTCGSWGGGASGLLGVAVCVDRLHLPTVLCGIPMTKEPHFRESIVHNPARVWSSADSHWRGWRKPQNQQRMKGKVFSMSGRTRDLLGFPTEEWLHGLPVE